MKRTWLIPVLSLAAAACVRSDAQDLRSRETGFGGEFVAKLESVLTHGEWVTYAGVGGDSVRGYIAFPSRADAAPAMIVIHENTGLSDFARTVVDDMAAKGFVALAPDLLTRRGGTPASTDSARRILGTLVPDSITVDLNATAAYLKSLKSVKRDAIGVIGFCWGGGQTFRYATNNPDLKVAVVCYGPAPDLATVSRINAKVYGAYGGNDARINASLPDVDKAMQAAGKPFAHKVYPDARHGFLRGRGTGLEGAAAAAEAAQADTGWADIFAFLKKNLGS